MPWKETCPMDERIEFIAGYLRGAVPVTELCAEAGISGKTGYKWIRRYEQEGPRGLLEKSRARHTQAHRTTKDQVERILKVRRQYRWGHASLRIGLRRCGRMNTGLPPVPSARFWMMKV